MTLEDLDLVDWTVDFTGISSGMSGSIDSDATSDTGTAAAPAVSSRGVRLGLARWTGGGGGGSGGGGP